MTSPVNETTNVVKWQGAFSLFDTEAEAIAHRASFVSDALTRPSAYVTAVPVTLVGDDAWACGGESLTDAELLSGNFSGFYNVSSQYNSSSSIGLEAEYLPSFMDLYEADFLETVPQVSKYAGSFTGDISVY